MLHCSRYVNSEREVGQGRRLAYMLLRRVEESKWFNWWRWHRDWWPKELLECCCNGEGRERSCCLTCCSRRGREGAVVVSLEPCCWFFAGQSTATSLRKNVVVGCYGEERSTGVEVNVAPVSKKRVTDTGACSFVSFFSIFYPTDLQSSLCLLLVCKFTPRHLFFFSTNFPCCSFSLPLHDFFMLYL